MNSLLFDESNSNESSRIQQHHSQQQAGTLLAGPGALRQTGRGAGLVKLTVDQQEALTRAKKYAMEQSIKSVLVKQTIAHQQQQQKSLQRHQALVLMCRVYVGSISFELKEDTIRHAFSPFGPIKSINMSWDPITQKHKGFAFVEYDLPEAAQLALEQMNSVTIGGRAIKVGRPSNMPQAAPIIEQIMEEAKRYSRIYIASIHPDLEEEDLKTVFEAFGTIKMCKLATATSTVPGVAAPKHKGYGFIDYETEQSANDAIASMNLFDLGGQFLRVGRGVTPPTQSLETGMSPALPTSSMPTAAAVAAAAVTAKIQAIEASGGGAGNGHPPPLINTPPSLVALPPTGLTIPSAVVSSTTGQSPKSLLSAGILGTSSMAGVSQQLISPVGLVATASISNPPVVVGSGNPSGVAASHFGFAGTSNGTMITSASSLSSGLPMVSSNSIPLVSQNEKLAAAMEAAALIRANRSGHSLGMSGIGDSFSATCDMSAAERSAAILDEMQSLQQQENMVIKGTSQRQVLMQKLMRKTESKVVVLRNMVGADEVDDELEDEVTEECGRYGTVSRVIIYKERQGEEEEADVIVKIFVEFNSPLEAVKSRDSLNGRYFGGRAIRAELYDQTLFEESDLSG